MTDAERLAAILDLAVDGMLTDGGHHKQWFLEQIAMTVVDGSTVTATATDARGEQYEYERLNRSVLEEQLAARRIHFDDSEMPEYDLNDEYWCIEPGIAP